MPRHLTWENFSAALLLPGIRAKHRLNGTPVIDIYVEQMSLEIGMLLPALPGETTPRLRAHEMRVDALFDGGIAFIRLSTSAKHLYQPFYFFMLLVADLIQKEGLSASAAILEAAKRWDRLRQGPELLSTEEQLGLMGELWCLLRLISTSGPAAIDSWIGPEQERHDFRLDQRELEVKTAVHAARVHIVHGLQQLEPSPGHKLYLLSLHLQPAGNGQGFSLSGLIEDVRSRLTVDAVRRMKFEEALEGLGFRDECQKHYVTTYCQRALPAIIPAEDCPRITKDGIAALLGEKFPRLEDIRYTIDVDGLGFVDGSTSFLHLLPNN